MIDLKLRGKILRAKKLSDLKKQGLTYEDIGKELDITRERVRQIVHWYEELLKSDIDLVKSALAPLPETIHFIMDLSISSWDLEKMKKFDDRAFPLLMGLAKGLDLDIYAVDSKIDI